MRRTELRLCAMDEETQAVLDDAVGTLVDTYQVLQRLLDDFADIVDGEAS